MLHIVDRLQRIDVAHGLADDIGAAGALYDKATCGVGRWQA